MAEIFINTMQGLLVELAGKLPGDIQPLLALSKRIELEANEAFIRKGDLTRRVAFVEKGLVRAYTNKDNGEDATLFLRWEGQFVASHDTILHLRASRFTYRAMEPSVLIEIDYDALEDLLKINPGYEPLRNFFLMRMLAETLHMMEAFVLQSPEERYRELLSEKFDLVNRVPDKYLASMLGITPVSLSRIRKRMHQKERG